jgi:hypothetical protein
VKINLDGKAPGKAIDIRGRIKKITRPDEGSAGKALGTLLIEGEGNDKPRFDKAIVRVTADTSINLMRGQERTRITFDEFRTGDRVEARFTPGPVLMSYPVQATAADITVNR